MSLVLDVLILYILEHHVESIFDVIFGPSGHFLDYFGPLITYVESFFQDQNILLQSERIFFNLRIEEIHPPFAALFTIPIGTKIGIESGSYL